MGVGGKGNKEMMYISYITAKINELAEILKSLATKYVE